MKIFLPNYRQIFILIVAISIITILSVYSIEYFFHAKPCPLCIYQRIPYFTLILVGGVGYLFSNSSTAKYICYLCAVIFFTGAIIALYHTGIERKVITEPASCSADLSGGANLESLKKQIKGNTTACQEVKFRIMGFSLAEMNAAFSFFMFVYILFSARKIENRTVKIRESLEQMGIHPPEN